MSSDGWSVLGSPQIGQLLAAVVATEGGQLHSWMLDQVDRTPGEVSTVSYLVSVDWPGRGRHEELIGVTARAGGPDETDRRARSFTTHGIEVVAWRYPDDPELPGLRTAAFASAVAALFNERQLVPGELLADDITLSMVTYRPRRRAVVRAELPRLGSSFYLKSMRADRMATVLSRHRLLRDHRLPVPQIVAADPDALIVMPALTGEPLAARLYDGTAPINGHQLVDLLDALPPAVAELPRRKPWADHVGHFADLVATALPEQAARLGWMTSVIVPGLAHYPPGQEPTHGDFHEAQVFVAGGRITGLLDIDTIGPGRRADDLACLLAHLSTVQGMSPAQAHRLQVLMRTWTAVFDHRVDPVELRLRTAAVIISLASGPFRAQEPDWPRTTVAILDAAEHWLRQVTG